MELLKLVLGTESCWEGLIEKGKTDFSEWRINKQSKLDGVPDVSPIYISVVHVLETKVVCAFIWNSSEQHFFAK